MRRKGVSYAKYGYFFSIPFVLAFLVFTLYPIGYTILIGFTDLKGFQTDLNFYPDVFHNFQLILANQVFLQSLYNTALIWIVNFVPQIILALLLTAWFTNRRLHIKGQGAFKVMLYMPNIITAATIAILFNAFFGYPMGPINDILVKLGIYEGPVYFFQDKTTTRGIVAFIQFWMWYGNTMIVLIAGVLGINPSLFEAAEIDGATGTQTFFRITLPSLRTIMLYVLVTSMIGGLNMFDIPLLLNLGRPDNSTLTTSVFIYTQAFQGSRMYSRAAAASLIMFVIIGILSGVLFYVMRDKDNAKLKKQKRALLKAQRAEARRAAV